MGKKTAIVAGAVFAALILLLLLVPAAIDWTGYKGEVAARLTAALGRTVTIAGPLRLRLLPSPQATAEGVGVANPPGSEPTDMATIPVLRLRPRLLPLLSDRVEVGTVVLEHPEIHLQRLADGRANWQPTPTPKAAAATPAKPAPAGPQASAPAAAGNGGGAVEIVDGTVTYGPVGTNGAAGGVPVRLDGIDARLEMDSSAGPFAAVASARWHGIALGLDVRLGRPLPGQPAPLSLTLALPSADARLTLAGSFGDDPSQPRGGPAVHGRLTLSAPSPGALSAALGGPAMLQLPGALSRPLSGEATLAADADEATLSDLALSCGPLRAGGSIAAAFARTPRIDVTLDVPSLDLDTLAKPAIAPAGAPAGATTSRVQPSTAAFAPVAVPPAGTASGFALPSDLFVNTVVTVGALPWHGKVAQQARLEATLDQGDLVVEHAGLLLPGGTAVKADGTLAAGNGGPQFDGHLDVLASDLREALAWAGIDPAAVPADRLHRFVLSAAVKAVPGALAFDHVEVGLDAIAATGSAAIQAGGARPSASLTLAADTVDLDAYLPAPPPVAEPGSSAVPAAANAPPAATAPGPAGGTGKPLQPGLDASLDLQVHHLTYRRVAADGVAVAATLADGTLSLGHAEAMIAGSTVKASGTVRGLGQDQPQLDGVVLQVDSPEPGRLAHALRARWAAALDHQGPLTADASLSGGAESIDAKLRATTGGVVLTADGTVADPLAARRFTLAIAAHADHADQAIRLLSPGFRTPAALGPLALAARIAGDARAVDVSGLDLRLGESRMTGTAQANLTGHRPMITAALAAGALDLDPFLGAARGDAGVPPPPRAPHAAGRHPAAAVAPTPPDRSGGSPLSHEPLDLSALQSVDGVVDLKADALSWKTWRLDTAVAHVVLDNGTATLDKLAGKLLGGSLTLTARLSGGSLPQLTGALAVAGADIGHAGLGGSVARITQGRMDADARFATAGRSSADMAARLGGDAKVAVHDGVVAGFDLPAVDRQMASPQNIGSLLGLVPAGLSGGSTRFSLLAASFRADSGVVVTRDARLDADGGTATATATVDLPRWTLDSAVDIRLANGTAPPLTLRFEGPLDHPRKIIDVNALQRSLAEHGLGAALKGDGAASAGRQLLQNLFKGLGGK
jgi:uncharacterized protein involved in outer membrane biogenesis